MEEDQALHQALHQTMLGVYQEQLQVRQTFLHLQWGVVLEILVLVVMAPEVVEVQVFPVLGTLEQRLFVDVKVVEVEDLFCHYYHRCFED